MLKKLVVVLLFAVLLFGCIGGGRGAKPKPLAPSKPAVIETPTLEASPSPEAVEPSTEPTIEPSPDASGETELGLDDLGVEYADEGSLGEELESVEDYN